MPRTKDYNLINWHEIFEEDSTSPTGLIWKVKPNNRIKSRSNAGCVWTNKSGQNCFQVTFNKTNWLIHRILYVMRHGKIDNTLYIDHIDGNSLNNSENNLRLVFRSVNNRNQRQRTNNSSGVTGVSFKTNKNGATYAVSQWKNLSGKSNSKYFSYSKLGLLEAFAAACAYREKMIDELNESGAGYTGRHGI